MPKKTGINTKAVEARDRKKIAKVEARRKAEQEAEDNMWQDDDKNLSKKKQRKEEQESKRAEALRRKAELKSLHDKEMLSLQNQTQGKQPISKLNRLQIQEEMEKRNRNAEIANEPKVQSKRIVQPPPLEQNLNHAMADTMIATNIDEALAVLSVNEVDSHPERRSRAIFKTFQAANLPRIRAENPTLRLTQCQELLMKEWERSPDNPKNAYA